MDPSLFLAKLLGPYCLIVAVGVLMNLKTYREMVEDLLKNSAVVYFAGVFALFFGLLIILFHNLWVSGWPLIITLLGWLGLIKGIVIIVFPNFFSKLIAFHLKNSSALMIRLGVLFVIGLALTRHGYF